MRLESCLGDAAVLNALVVREQIGLHTILQSMQSLLVFLVGELVIISGGSSQLFLLTTTNRLDLTYDLLDVV